MKKRSILAMTVLACLTSCGGAPDVTSIPMQEIRGRGDEKHRLSVYRVRAPEGWIRRDPLSGENLNDTTKALCEFIIMEGSEVARIAIHNFPSAKLEDRVPVEAQVARWRRQFETLNAAECETRLQSFSGYSGLYFQGCGRMQGKPTMVLGWVLQLSPEHYLMLSRSSLSSEEDKVNSQMRSDVTIKAVGPQALMEKHKHEIIEFARTFELIEEIPTRA